MSKFVDACIQLKVLLNASQGKPIEFPSGVVYEFHLIKLYTLQEITSFELKFNLILPDSFKYFLSEVGASQLYVDNFGLGFDFIPLDEIYNFSSDVFLEMENPFPQLFLFASNTGRGDVIGFDLRKAISDKMSIFSHEDDPETWLDDTERWSTFENWLIQLVSSEAEIDLI